MPITDNLYAYVETDFFRRPDILELPAGAKVLYLALWLNALEQRRETIKRPSDHYLATMAGLPRHPIASYLSLLHDGGLLLCTCDAIVVKGLKEKHSKIKFKDEVEKTQDESKNLENSQVHSSLPFPALPCPEDSFHESSSAVAETTPTAKATDTSKPKAKIQPSDPLVILAHSLPGFPATSHNLTDEWIEAQKKAFPFLDLESEIRMAGAYYLSNPRKAPAKQLSRCLCSWFIRSDRSRAMGTNPSKKPQSSIKFNEGDTL